MGAGSIDNKTIPSRELGGSNSITLNESNLPVHKHNVSAEIDLSQSGLLGDHYHGFGFNWNNDGFFYSNGRDLETIGRNVKENQVCQWNGNNGGGYVYKDTRGYNMITSSAVPISKTIEVAEKQKVRLDKDTTEVGGGAGFDITNPYTSAYIWERIG